MPEVVGDPKRLDAVAAALGRVAHDFNNLLTPLISYPPLIEEELTDGSPARKMLLSMQTAAEEMARLNQRLLEVSRRQTSHRDVFTLNEVALLLRAEMETSARAHGFSLAFDLADDAAPVRGSIDRVAQALRNVWTNAIEHAAAGDVIRVSTRNVTTRGAAATEIAVEDSGAGIPTEILERVFEPFVTTKTGTENRAAGLGLSLVFRIVQDHGGEVSIVCGNPVGTTVRLDFPAIVAGGRNVGADR